MKLSEHTENKLVDIPGNKWSGKHYMLKSASHFADYTAYFVSLLFFHALPHKMCSEMSGRLGNCR